MLYFNVTLGVVFPRFNGASLVDCYLFIMVNTART